MTRSVLTFLFCALTIVAGSAQRDTVRLRNPSFEDTPRRGGDSNNVIKDWFDCGSINFRGESPPDIHPNGYWQNNLPASDKRTYLGMVVRDNNTWESVSQRLDTPLEAGKCYSFTIHLSRAPKYVSKSHMTNDDANYTTPVVLRIWGGNGFCDDKELLAESDAVSNSSWQIYVLQFKPKANVRSITLEAYYKTPTLYPYNGNVLVDGCSDIIRVPCPGEEIAADTKPKLPPHKRIKNKQDKTKPTEKPASEIAAVEKPFKPKIMQELNRSFIKEGQTIEIKTLKFKADSSAIDRTSYEVLEEIKSFLVANEDVIIEVGGHTNSLPADEYCDRLSTARAKAVVEYLVSRGVDPSKVQFKGYGKKQPIADNKTKYGRERNQRVEIKILSLNS